MEHIFEVLLHSIIDCAKMLPILYLSYLLMELLEHKAGNKMRSAVFRRLFMSGADADPYPAGNTADMRKALIYYSDSVRKCDFFVHMTPH